jgi:hypothetical protein
MSDLAAPSRIYVLLASSSPSNSAHTFSTKDYTSISQFNMALTNPHPAVYSSDYSLSNTVELNLIVALFTLAAVILVIYRQHPFGKSSLLGALPFNQLFSFPS